MRGRRPMSAAPRIRLREVSLYERPVTLRLPFRFGAATVTHAPQAFVFVEAEIEGRRFTGAAAELMVPKWFDKNPALTHDQNAQQLRESLRLARASALAAGPAQSAHALSLSAGADAVAQAVAQGLPRLAAQFGAAQIDKAVADAALRFCGLGWCEGLKAGVLGDPWSRGLSVGLPASIHLRHTVGLADRLTPDEPGADPQDGLPTTLQDAIERYGLSHFKLKLCGDPAADIQRLRAIAQVLDGQAGDYRVTLDGNESFAEPAVLGALWNALANDSHLRSLRARVLLLEQPLPRRLTLDTAIGALGIDVPVIIDESDDQDDAFERALALGYRGVSSKACKGLYRSLHNAARIAGAGDAAGSVLSGEDLTCQAGLAVQQDTLLAASLGVRHIERNGHHYVDGFGSAPTAEAEAFAQAHPGFYRRTPGGVRLAITHGQLDLRSLHVPGFATAVHPRPADLIPLS
jgi:Enolase C-terminal domain-like